MGDSNMGLALNLNRKRIEQELHDGLCQLLIGISHKCQRLENRLRGDGGQGLSEVQEISGLLTRVIDNAYRIIKGQPGADLRPSCLTASLRTLATEVGCLYGIRCEFTSSCGILTLDPNIVLHLTRITQEAVSNAVRHGKANHIRLNLSTQNNRIVLIIRDNGTGIPVASLRKGGLGLGNMRERANAIGARLSIQRASGGGTSVRCSLSA
jgi:signal transduction histidine kinase